MGVRYNLFWAKILHGMGFKRPIAQYLHSDIIYMLAAPVCTTKQLCVSQPEDILLPMFISYAWPILEFPVTAEPGQSFNSPPGPKQPGLCVAELLLAYSEEPEELFCFVLFYFLSAL